MAMAATGARTRAGVEHHREHGRREERIACAALVRAAGCSCDPEMLDGSARVRDGEVETHVPWCPFALAASIEARGAILPACPTGSASSPPGGSCERPSTSTLTSAPALPIEPPPSAAPSPRSSGEPSGPTSSEILAWAVRTFGPVASDRQERARRVAEEAIEVAQAEGVAAEEIHRIANRAFSRPPGDLEQEVGGLAVTLAALCANAGLDPEAAKLKEWDRISSLPESWLRRKHAAKVLAGTAAGAVQEVRDAV
jgi:hypothetical protein